MKIDQLFYTSCKKGLSSGMGFQTHSCSEGISEEEIKEIERHCVYIPPENLPSYPTKEEIEELFPVAFSFFKLESGKPCICRAKYIGQDYSGRFGNYFCHVLVFNEDELPFYPIELYDSSIFRDSLMEDEEEIKRLPMLDQIPKGSTVTLEAIENFLKEAGSKKRTKCLSVFVDGIIAAKINNKRILFCDSSNSLPLWIGAATMTLPVALANLITFTTYSFDAENSEEFISGGLKTGTRVDFNNKHEDYKFYKFDFQEEYYSEFNFRSKFSSFAALGYTIVKDYRKEFIAFAEQFEYVKINEDIDACVNLLNFIHNGLEKIDEEEAIRALGFANKYGKDTVFEKFMVGINEDNLARLTININLELTEIIYKFMLKIALLTNNAENTDKTYKFLFAAFHSMIVDSEQISLESILSLHDKLRTYAVPSNRDFILKSVEAARLENISVYLEGGKPRHAQFYLCSVLGNFMALKLHKDNVISWKSFGNNGVFPLFAERALNILVQNKKELIFTLNYVLSNSDYFINLILLSYKLALKKADTKVVVDCLNEILNKISLGEGIGIRNSILSSKQGGDILIDAYKAELENSSDKKLYYKDYCNTVFYNSIEYKKQYFSAVTEELIKYLKCEDVTLEDYIWLTQYIKKESLDKHLTALLAKKIVFTFQKIIPIAIPNASTKALINEVNYIANRYNIQIKPNISEIIEYINELNWKPNLIQKILLQEKSFKFEGIDEESYEELLKLAFEIICPHLNDMLSHARLKKLFLYEKHSEIYYKTYLKVNTYMYKEERDREEYKTAGEKYMGVVYFLLKSFDSFSENGEQYFNEKICETLKALDKGELKDYFLYMHNLISKTTLTNEQRSIRKRWDALYEIILRNSDNKSFISKLLRNPARGQE